MDVLEVEKSFTGMDLTIAILVCEQNEWDYRVVKEDGRYSMITCDLRTDRMNFEVDKNTVTRAYFG